MTATHSEPDLGQGFDELALIDAVRALIEAVGENPQREGLKESPHRIASMYRELFDGLYQDPLEILSVGFEEGHDELVIRC